MMLKAPGEKGLFDAFVEHVPRETAGPRSANRFAYQQSWALCLLLELHKTSSEYLMVFDYHDDVVVFDSETSPSSVSFYQVKSGKKQLTLNALLQRKSEKGVQSIIGKMFANTLIFPDDAWTVTLVSNGSYKLRLAKNPVEDEVVDRACLAALCSSSIIKISQTLQEEHKLPFSPISFNSLFLEPTALHEDHFNHSLGRLAAFLEELDPTGKYSTPAAHRAIRGTIQIRNNCEEKLRSTADLSRKSIGKKEFDEILKKVLATPKTAIAWDAIRQSLIHEGIPVFKILKYQSNWEKYEVDRMDATNSILSKLQKIIRSFIYIPSLPMSEYIEDVISKAKSDQQFPHAPYQVDDEYLAAMILLETYELTGTQ